MTLQFDIKIRYLASVYVDADSIVANKETLRVCEGFGVDNLIPVPALEGDVSRVAFHSPQDGLTVVIKGERYDISEQGTVSDSADTEVAFHRFAELAAHVLSHTLEFFGRRGHRLALVRESLLTELESNQLNRICLHTINTPPSFRDPPPFEWSWRVGNRRSRTFGNRTEDTFAIGTARRLRGTYSLGAAGPTPFDRIRLDVDLNTASENTIARFEPQDVQAFMRDSQLWHREVSVELLAHLSEGLNK